MVFFSRNSLLLSVTFFFNIFGNNLYVGWQSNFRDNYAFKCCLLLSYSIIDINFGSIEKHNLMLFEVEVSVLSCPGF